MSSTGMGRFAIAGCLVVLLGLIELCASVVHYPRITVGLKNSGFHREIDYVLKLPKEIDCSVIIVQTLHQGIYISNDQLNDLKRMKLIQSYVSSYINVETTMEKSSPFTIYLFDRAQEYIHIRLPIHLRYQAPATRKSFKTVPLVEPTIYFSCPSEFYERKTNATYKLPCPNANDIDNVYELPNAESCDWFDVDFISSFEGPTSISVPVGNQSLGIPVFILTLLVAWGAAAYLIFAVLKQKQRISKKVS